MSQKLQYKDLQFGIGLNYTNVVLFKGDAINQVPNTTISVLPKFSYSAKMTTLIKYKKNKFYFGFTFNNHKFKQKIEGLKWESDSVNNVYQSSITYVDANINNIGLLLTYNLPLNEKNSFYIGLNPYLSIKKGGNIYAIRNVDNVKILEEKLKDLPLKKINFGIQIGYRLNVPINKNLITIIEPHLNVLGFRENLLLKYSKNMVYFGGINFIFSKEKN